MNKQTYLTKRTDLHNRAQTLIDKDKLDEANNVMDEIEALDNTFEKTGKAQANLNALKGGHSVNSVIINSAIDNADSVASVGNPKESDDAVYEKAWANLLQKKPLTNEQATAFEMVNDFVHTTENRPILIPKTVAAKIWEEVENIHPYWNDVTKTYVKGAFTILKSTDSSDAGWYDESTGTKAGEEDFENWELSGCELSRAIPISWKLKEMATAEFIPFVVKKLAEKTGHALSYGSLHGKGKPSKTDTFKPEPLGTVTDLQRDLDKAQIVEYSESDPLTYKKTTQARALILGNYSKGIAVYANSTTIWTEIANIVDSTGKVIFVPDATAGGVGRMFGNPVKEESGLCDGEILFSNAAAGYHANINKNITLDFEDHKRKRYTDYIAYGIVDGAPITRKAHALLVKTASESHTHVDTPTATPNGGTFNVAQTVTLNCTTSDSKIVYTTDGSNPTKSKKAYSEPFAVAETTTIKAKAYKDGMKESELLEIKFTIE